MPVGVVLAAGRGERLGPLTRNIPKPLLPVANQPVMSSGTACIRKAGIAKICINLWYRAEQIRDTIKVMSPEDVALHWSHEQALLGTAGALKAMAQELSDDLIVVLAGDALVDVDLTPLLAFHQAVNAFVTLATMPVMTPERYGVVICTEDGRVQHFQEKPAPGTAMSHCANTGIYIFNPGIVELIPDTVPCDFAHDIFPRVLHEKLPFYAQPLRGYWRDIGDPSEYLLGNLDALDGRLALPTSVQLMGSNCIAEDAQARNATLHRCVVGEKAYVPSDCQLERCLVWPEARVPSGTVVTDCIFTTDGHYSVKQGAIVKW